MSTQIHNTHVAEYDQKGTLQAQQRQRIFIAKRPGFACKRFYSPVSLLKYPQ